MKSVLIIAGPTAVGKTAVAETVAEKLSGELISADSRQIYKGLDVGTAKPRNPKIPYHLIDIVAPEKRYDAAQFARDAQALIKQIHDRGKIPIIVGGTGLYIRALTVGIFEGNFRDETVREELLRRWRAGENLYAELMRVDPEAAKKIDPKNFVRIQRALEVYIVSGKPISHWWKTATKKPSEWKFVKIILNKERKALYERIEKRVDEMLEAGWVDEVKNLLKSGVTENAPAFSSIGYRQVVDYIKGKLSWEQMREQIIKATKEYARRQLIWFRKEPGAVWLDTTGKNSQEVALEVIKIWRETEKNA